MKNINLPIELQKDLNDLKIKFKNKGYIIKDIQVEKQDYDFWDLFYNKEPLKAKKRNEDDTPINPWLELIS